MNLSVCSLSTFCFLGTILGSGNGTVDKIDCGFALLGLTLCYKGSY